MDKDREEFSIECKICSARSIAIVELEKYLIERFNLEKVELTSPPEKFLCLVRFTRGKHGQYYNICKVPNQKAREDVEECLSELKPKKISEINGIFYLF